VTNEEIIERARAAERKLAAIARHRRPTDAETAEANEAYAAAAAVQASPPRATVPRDLDPDRCVPDSELQKALPAYNGWHPTYEYPGFIFYTHPHGDYAVTIASDFNGDACLDIQISTADLARSINDGENGPWPHEGRTAEKMFARIRPYLDKYQPTASTPSKES